jgi:hypothetical protein
MHGQLREAYVRGRNGEVGHGLVSQCRSSAGTGAVGELLERHACPAAHFFENGGRKSVCSISLRRVVFDDRSLIDGRPVDRIRRFGIIGMDRVGVVCADHKGAGREETKLLVVAGKRICNPVEYVGQKTGISALS